MKKSAIILAAISAFACLAAGEIASIWPLPAPMRKYDANGDNLIKGPEITKDIARFDLNGDGIITPSEAIYVLAADDFKKECPDYAPPQFAAPKLTNSQHPAFKNTILVSMDGFDRAVLKELLDADKLPALRKIARANSNEDFIVNVTLSGHQTETKPGHATMLTGLIPEHTRVQTNARFLPIPEGLTIFERIKARNPDVKTVFVSSKRENVGAMTAEELGNRVEKGLKIEGGPYLNAKKNIDLFSATDKTPTEAIDTFLDSLGKVKNDPFFAFLHFRSPDREGHAKGRESTEYREIAKEVDSHIAKLLQFLQNNNLNQNTRIIITADHGFNPNAKHHHFAPWISMITNDPALLTTKTPNLFDIPASIMAAFGVNLQNLDPMPFGKDISQF